MDVYGFEQFAVISSPLRRLAVRAFGTYDLGARVRYAALERALDVQIEPGRILDAGCGFGSLCFALERRWPRAEILGVDAEPELVEHCQRVRETVRNSRVRFEATPLPAHFDRPFDLITSVDVLEHIDDDAGFVRGLFDATAPGGTLMLHTPATPQRRYLAHFEEQHDHVRDGYAPADLQRLVQGAGYVVTGLRATFGTLGAVGWEGFALAREGNRVARAALPAWYGLSTLDSWRVPRRGNGLLITAVRAGS